jgi:hypothetical protein
MNRSMACFVGFLVGAGLGLGLCCLVLSFEFTGGPSSGVSVHAFGANIFTTYGFFVGIVPAIVYVLLSGLIGIADAIIGGRMARSHDGKGNDQNRSGK